MKKLNKTFLMVAIVTLSMAALSACGKNETSIEKSSDKINVVATIFPEYDFLRQIGGDRINLSMLLTPGAESHSFEPTPQTIKSVVKSDLFVYVGGDSDAWVDTILDNVDDKKTKVVTLMDCVSTVEEELVEGMMSEEKNGTGSEADEETEYDEHVWTSPENAKLIVQKLCENLCSIDPENTDYYKSNANEYIDELDKLNQKFRDVVTNAKRREIIVGDRFPFRYFADEYGLTYYAAFPGCSTDTEASAATIAFLNDKVRNDNIPVVFHIELSNTKICDAICEATGAKSELLNAVHNVSKQDFEAGVTYIDLMEHNVDVLKEALN